MTRTDGCGWFNGLLASRIAALGLISVLSGCGEASSRTLVVTGEESGNLAALVESGLIREFTDSTGIHVEIVPQTFELLQENAALDLSSTGSPRYHVILNYNFALGGYVSNGLLLEYDSLKAALPTADWSSIEARLYPNQWREVAWFGATSSTAHPIALPFAANSILLAVNRRFFPADHPVFGNESGRATWEEFETALKDLAASGHPHSMALTGASGGWLYYEWAAVTGALAGGAFGKQFGWEPMPEGATLLTPELISATDRYLALREFNRGDYYSTGAVEQKSLILTDSVAFAFVWSDYARQLFEEGAARGLDIGFVPVPGEASMLAGGAAFINRRIENPEDAARFLIFLLSPRVQDSLTALGYQSPLANLSPHPFRFGGLQRALVVSLNSGAYMNDATPEATLISTSITQAIQEAWRNPSPRAIEVLRRADALIRSGLSRRN